jgi:DNA invertase Pin-like site-specific DNA recombinase
MSRKDIIRWVIDAMLEEMASPIADDLALRVERRARAEWGGQRIEYVPRTIERKRPGRLPPEAHQQVIDDVLSSAEPMNALAERHGVSRRTIYRLLKRGPAGRS